ncbi:MAG: hypothetical protein ACOYOH_23360 [Paracraurococcus sp.]
MLNAMTGHVTRNLWLWTAIGFAVTAIAAYGRSTTKGYYLAEILTLAAMFAGTTMILISQQGLPQPVDMDDDEA